jgi:hypothetical protein
MCSIYTCICHLCTWVLEINSGLILKRMQWRYFYVLFFRRSRVRIESYYSINLVFIFAVNVFFFFSGISLNSLVILSFWRSVQLGKKLCYFMIMVLSCCDLLAVLTTSPLIIFVSMSWLTGKLDVNARWPHISIRSTGIFLRFSLFALLVMNFDRYLATSYPIFHRTSVTKGRLLTLLAILIIVEITLVAMSVNNSFIFVNNQFGYFQPSTYSNSLYSCHSCNVIYQLQTVSSRQEKS